MIVTVDVAPPDVTMKVTVDPILATVVVADLVQFLPHNPISPLVLNSHKPCLPCLGAVSSISQSSDRPLGNAQPGAVTLALDQVLTVAHVSSDLSHPR